MSAAMDYESFLTAKTHSSNDFGFKPKSLPDWLFPFQRDLVMWALERGRSAIFADCGLGKTPMQLVWADQVQRKTRKPVLILTPLAVSFQTIGEAAKFDIKASRSIDGTVHPITVTNYERLHYFKPEDFSGVVCDESSILKSFDGARRTEITAFMRRVQYRLLCTATAAPNDYIELGTSSEALGCLGYTDMLGKFFKNDQGNVVKAMRGISARNQFSDDGKWRFKGHAEKPFWQWVCSWARAVRRPSDLGYENDGFILPALTEQEHHVDVQSIASGMLFNLPAVGLKEQRDERRRSITERCQKVADLVSDRSRQSLIWCHLNDEGDMLENLIPDAVQVSGKNSDDEKEDAFIRFAKGEHRALITKPKIGAWGLNFQNCHHVTFFPSHSFEQYYQGVRRCWRFGQKYPVHVDIVTTEGEQSVLANLQRKATAADTMFANLIAEMNQAMHVERTAKFTNKEVMPKWL
jgi:hypothetical protein